MKSTLQKIEQCEGLIGTKDVTPWEDEFLSGIVERYHSIGGVPTLTAKQIEVLDRIHSKHFA